MARVPMLTSTILMLAILLFALNAGGGVPWDPISPGWAGGVIPYVFDENVPDWVREEAGEAMAEWTEKTILQFVPRTNEPDPLVIAERCRGRKPCFQASHWFPNNVHGLGHGIWLEHEQQRRDRDQYIQVFQKHISPHKRGTWNPRFHYERDVSVYNYQSIMHYGFLSSKRNRRGGPPQMETIPPHMPVGQLDHITPGDADTVARMFGLAPSSWTISTNPLGLTVVVDGTEVTTPAVFDWTPGSEHTLSVPSPQVQPGNRYWFGRWSDRGADAFGETRTVIATGDTTLYEANFVAAHGVSTRVHPEGAGAVNISPDSPDGYYPLRSEVTMSAEPTAGSGFRFLQWEVASDSRHRSWFVRGRDGTLASLDESRRC